MMKLFPQQQAKLNFEQRGWERGRDIEQCLINLLKVSASHWQASTERKMTNVRTALWNEIRTGHNALQSPGTRYLAR